jgi:hypothetical protein
MMVVEATQRHIDPRSVGAGQSVRGDLRRKGTKGRECEERYD